MLLGAQLGFEQQPRHAEHAVHRRADLVAHGGEEAGLGAASGFRLVARVGNRVFQRLALGDVAPDALHFDQAPGVVAHRIIFPRDPAPAVSRADMLVVSHTRLSGLEPREAAEIRCTALRVQFRREGPSDRALRVQAEQFEKGVVAIGEPAVRRAAEDRVALGIDQRLVARFALIEPGIERGRGGERLLQPGAGRFELGRLAVQHFGALPRHDEFMQQEGEDDRHENRKNAGRHQGEAVVQHDIAERDHQQGERDQSQKCAKCAQNPPTVRKSPAGTLALECFQKPLKRAFPAWFKKG